MIYSASTYLNAINSLLELQKKSERETEIAAIGLVVGALREKYQRDILDYEPLTKQDLADMDFQRVWIAYPSEDIEDIVAAEDCGEWAFVYHGTIYNISTLEGSGFEDLLLDCMNGENIDNPSGEYQIFKTPRFYRRGITCDTN